jgi:hypothetical protein
VLTAGESIDGLLRELIGVDSWALTLDLLNCSGQLACIFSASPEKLNNIIIIVTS